MNSFLPKKILYEQAILEYPLGVELFNKYKDLGIEMLKIEKHHNVPFVKESPDEKFIEFKKYLVLGVRKSLTLSPNKLSADFIVPFTSSGCSAMCTYCYLVCNFFKGSYLRIFVNRDAIMDSVKKKAKKIGEVKVYEIGSTSDMVLENTITGNLRWAIEKFGEMENAICTFATKFSMVDELLDAKHNGHTRMRISVNPEEIISKIEIGTSSLDSRIEAANKMFMAGYNIGINIAPIILVDNWKVMYENMFVKLSNKLNSKLKEQLFIEMIFMTYGIANEKINSVAMPYVINVFNKNMMIPKGRGKYCYKKNIRDDAVIFFKEMINKYIKGATISYIV